MDRYINGCLADKAEGDMTGDIHGCLAELADGDMAALGELYNMLSVRVFNYARAIAKNKEVAEDVTHDVFLQVHRKAASLARMKNPVGYIMTATRNHSFDHLRKGKHVTASIEDVPETASDAEPLDDKLLLEDALSSLPSNQRETVYLHYVCGFKQKEVSQIMGVPLATVKWRCSKALSGLQTYIGTEKG
jgi:RNA polymerase sigma-70 factor (ECF subfamily)